MTSMNTFKFLRNFVRLLKFAAEATRLPTAHLHFEKNSNSPENVKIFKHFTKPHPRYKLIPNKAIGMALVDLGKFCDSDSYMSSVNRKDLGGYHGKRALRRGYSFQEIDQNSYIEDIYAINTSIMERQGRRMDPTYFNKRTYYEKKPNYRYFGIINKDGKLVAYCNVVTYGNFSATDRLLGYKNNDGTMYLLLVEIICLLINDKRVQYFMYDTFFGVQEGLRSFKHRLGFQPYRVHYSLAQEICRPK